MALQLSSSKWLMRSWPVHDTVACLAFSSPTTPLSSTWAWAEMQIESLQFLSSSFPQLENIRYHWCHISILAKLRSPCVKCYFTAYIMSCSNELTINIECNCLKYYCEVQNYMWKCLVCFEKGRSCLCSGYMLSYIEILVRYFSAKIMQACPYRWSWI